MGLVFFIHSVTLCLLIGVFSPFTFKVIIDRCVFIAILLLVLWLFSNFPLILSSLALFHGLLASFSVMLRSFLIFFYVFSISFSLWLL